MTRNSIAICLIFILMPAFMVGQGVDSIQKANPEPKGKIFANIYTGFYTKNATNGQHAGFALSTGLFGYQRNITDKISGSIILDVTRTTNAIQVSDSSGNLLNVNYFEGSKFTAFLKMAEIKWNFKLNWSLSVGQLLNTQYLTFQDKFWAHRYVETTYQELNRFGSPADFGARLEYRNSAFAIDAGVFNGEGPFRNQDLESDFLVSLNVEYRPLKYLILKMYFGNQNPNGIDSLLAKQVYSAFAGLDLERLKIGLEYNYVKNPSFTDDYCSGFSGFAFYSLSKRFELFYRYDYTEKSANYQQAGYHIGGLQFKEGESFYTSINYRYLSALKEHGFYVNFGIKF